MRATKIITDFFLQEGKPAAYLEEFADGRRDTIKAGRWGLRADFFADFSDGRDVIASRPLVLTLGGEDVARLIPARTKRGEDYGIIAIATIPESTRHMRVLVDLAKMAAGLGKMHLVYTKGLPDTFPVSREDGTEFLRSPWAVEDAVRWSTY